LHPRLAGAEQPVGEVDVDRVASAAHVPVDDVLRHWEEVAQQGLVAGCLVVGADGLEIPQRGVDGVVLACLTFVGEAVR
jgi:hypothetical protein